jgi:hypothetical protein
MKDQKRNHRNLFVYYQKKYFDLNFIHLSSAENKPDGNNKSDQPGSRIFS